MNYITGTRIITVSRPDKRMNAFIQGGTIKSFSLPHDISEIAPHAFDNVAGLEEIIFTNQDTVVSVDADSGIASSVVFFVPAALVPDYAEEYPSRDITGYFDYVDSVPDYEVTWYSDEDCTTPISTSNFVSGTRYYCKLAEVLL